MEKPIIATNLVGLFIKFRPWKNAHELWFEKYAEELNDPSILSWTDKPNYFEGVDLVMKLVYPNLSDDKRTIKARETFFDSVCEYIEKHPEDRNEQVIDYFKSLKPQYRIALITSNTSSAINKILSILKINDLFDIIEPSLENEKDDKSIVFSRFIENHGKPIIYIGGSKKETYDFCNEHEIRSLFVNFENREDIETTENIHSLEELKTKIKEIS